MERIPLARPKLSGRERQYVLDCIDSNWISSIGKYISAFEEHFADFCGVDHAIATNNGTTSLHLALAGMGVQPGDEVLIPTLTYIATANAVRYCGARPVLIDSSETSLNIDSNRFSDAITEKTRGIIPVHLYGVPADMTSVTQFAQAHGLWTIEDAAESHGAEVSGCRTGSLGTCASFSFFGNKIITTGEGGMLTTNDGDLANHFRLLRGQGMDPNRRYWFPVIGYNYRMTNIQAAIGLAQLECVNESLEKRSEIENWYDDEIDRLGVPVTRVPELNDSKSVNWLYTVFLQSSNSVERDDVIRSLDISGIETRPVFYPMHQMPPYVTDKEFAFADKWAARGISLPTFEDLTRPQVSRVVASLDSAIKAL